MIEVKLNNSGYISRLSVDNLYVNDYLSNSSEFKLGIKRSKRLFKIEKYLKINVK